MDQNDFNAALTKTLRRLVEVAIRLHVFDRPVAQVVMEMEHEITSQILDEQIASVKSSGKPSGCPGL